MWSQQGVNEISYAKIAVVGEIWKMSYAVTHHVVLLVPLTTSNLKLLSTIRSILICNFLQPMEDNVMCHPVWCLDHCVIRISSILRLGGVIDSGGSSDSLNELGWNAVGASVIIVYYAVSSIVLFLFIERIGWYRYGTWCFGCLQFVTCAYT